MKIVPFTLAWLAFFATSVLAQNATQQVSGYVRDPTGATVAGASVTLTETSTQMRRTATTEGTGYYVIVAIPIGIYEVAIEHPGFKRFVKSNVQVTTGSKPTVNAKLEIGQQTETTIVSAEQPLVETSTGEIGRLISGEQVAKLQLNGRNFAQLALLMPGVTFNLVNTSDLLGGYGSQQGVFLINGGKRGMQSWNLDGADNRDSGGPGNNFININPDALAEFKMLTTNYSAEYGQNAGAVVNMAIKSGTSNFHGSTYGYFRNESLNAKPMNATTKSKDRWNNFGATLGGPIVIPGVVEKDTLFFFASVDFKRIDTDTAPTTWTVPTQDERNGILSTGIVPPAEMSPNMKRMIALYPLPNGYNAAGTLYNQYTFTAPAPRDLNQYLVKLNYNPSTSHQLSGHFAYDYYTSLQNQGNLMTYDRNISGQSAAVKWNWIVSPTAVHTFQVTTSMNRIAQVNFQPNAVHGITDTTRAGLGVDFPLIYGETEFIPSISIAGLSTLGVRPTDFQNFNRINQLKYDFAKVLATHNLKAGVLVVNAPKNQDNVPANINGAFSFTSLANAVRGKFNTYSEALRGREGWFGFNTVEAYVQDNWRVNRRLSVDVGLRFYYMQPNRARLNNAVVFEPRLYDPAKAPTLSPTNGAILSPAGTYDVTNGLAVGGDSYPETYQIRFPDYDKPPYNQLFKGMPERLTADETRLAPRFSFAYDVTGEGSTVVRGGYGMFFERIQGNMIFNLINNPPMVQDTTVTSSPTSSVENILSGTPRAAQVQNIAASIDENLKLPTVQNWSLGIQQRLGPRAAIDVAYVGSHGSDQTRYSNLNMLPLGTLQRNPGVNTNALRKYQGYGTISQLVTDGSFDYHGLQVLLKQSFSDSGLIHLSYTFSKTLTEGSDWNYTPVYSPDLEMDRGPSDAGRRHVFVASYVLPIPVFRNSASLAGKLLGGWELSGVTTLQSGRPLNITVNGDPAGIGTTGRQRPQVVGDWNTAGDRTVASFFDTAAFAMPAAGTFGNLSYNALAGPSYYNTDLSLHKAFRLKEGMRIEYRLEAFNVFNHANWLGVGSVLGTATFGQVTSFSETRRIQMALRFDF